MVHHRQIPDVVDNLIPSSCSLSPAEVSSSNTRFDNSADSLKSLCRLLQVRCRNVVGVVLLTLLDVV